jgi:hypothetical protein
MTGAMPQHPCEKSIDRSRSFSYIKKITVETFYNCVENPEHLAAGFLVNIVDNGAPNDRS